MRFLAISGLFCATAATLLLVGCGKTDTQTAQPEQGPAAILEKASNATVKAPAETQKAAAPGGATASQTVSNAAAAVQTTANQAVSNATTALQGTAAEAAAKAQQLISQAQQLVSNKKFQEALATLQQLGNVQLTPEQQKLVNDLKTQIQAALAGSAVGNALGVKP